MIKGLEALDEALGKLSKSNAGSGPARMVMLGKAQATEQLKSGGGTSFTELLLDPEAGKECLAEIRGCVAKSKVFREFDGLDRSKTGRWSLGENQFFGTKELRDNVFQRAMHNKVFTGGTKHLELYALDAMDEFEIELRRLKDPGRDPKIGLANAMAILEGLVERDAKSIRDFRSIRELCHNLCRVRKGDPIPNDTIKKLYMAYRHRSNNEQGIEGRKAFPGSGGTRN
ncbi:hypothetical protein diail_9592 [Diaporthe ilicicola]|nr:hypothetical protein diail_9592 [Diaporthe ilicicola]